MIIETKYGKILGKRLGNDLIRFAGIPYAKPPIGPLRWKAPEFPEPLAGVKKCEEFVNAAFQLTAEEWGDSIPSPYGPEFSIRETVLSEDCLYLNVWTKRQAIEEKRSLPVLVIIHGGGFESGSGSVPVLDGEALSRRDIVVVTINYRLGIFGYLAHPELSEESGHGTSGNYGTLDQILALKWIRGNIREFGGDPNRVTIAGESAGSLSVSILLESPLAAGLFSGAIMMSGSMAGRDTYCSDRSKKAVEQQGVLFLQEKGIDSIAELRNLCTKEVFSGTWGFFPYRDGKIWPEKNGLAWKAHTNNDVPLLVGNNADEGSIFSYMFLTEDYRDRFQSEAARRYGADAAVITDDCDFFDPILAASYMSKIYGEKILGFSGYETAMLQAKYGNAPAYYYYFDQIHESTKDFGAYHSSEIPYFYDNLYLCSKEFTADDLALQEQMSAYIEVFVKTGNPNNPHLPRWKELDADAPEVMAFGKKRGMMIHPAAARFQTYAKYEWSEKT